MRAAKELFSRKKHQQELSHRPSVSRALLSNRKQRWRMKPISIELGHKNEDEVFRGCEFASRSVSDRIGMQ